MDSLKAPAKKVVMVKEVQGVMKLNEKRFGILEKEGSTVFATRKIH